MTMRPTNVIHFNVKQDNRNGKESKEELVRKGKNLQRLEQHVAWYLSMASNVSEAMCDVQKKNPKNAWN